jgi:acetyl-CoA acetyltransferase
MPTPIIVGVGDIQNKSLKLEDATEPADLMTQATLQAISDIGFSGDASKTLQSEIDDVGVVNTWTWQYPDLPSFLAEKLGVKPKFKNLSHHGGGSPAKLFDEAARRIARGESKVAVVTGGEALASRRPQTLGLFYNKNILICFQ